MVVDFVWSKTRWVPSNEMILFTPYRVTTTGVSETLEAWKERFEHKLGTHIYVNLSNRRGAFEPGTGTGSEGVLT